MAIPLAKIGWLPVYREMREPNGFLTRLFTVKPGGIVNGEKVAIDVVRSGNRVAIVIKKGASPNLNDAQSFTTKEFTPPSYGESFPIDANDLLSRMAGTNPLEAAYEEYAAQLIQIIANGFRLIGDMITRALELQASQILQTGKLALVDSASSLNYELDFLPKSSHFPTASPVWGNASDHKLADIEALANLVRSDGKVDPDMLIFGSTALGAFLDDAQVQKRLDNRSYDLGEIAPDLMDSGATFFGYVQVGSYKMQIWSYIDTYEHPATGTVTPFIGANKVVVLSSRTRLDMVSARVPLPLSPDPRLASLIPPRLSSREEGFDVTPNIYASENGKQIRGELESRTLLIPVQIDGFGCLTTT